MKLNPSLRRTEAAVRVIGCLLTVQAAAGNLDPTNAPGPTMHTLEEIYQALNAVAPHPQTLAPTTSVIGAGYYAATNLAQVDPDLTAGNVRAGVNIFGVTGNSNVVNTSSGDATVNDLLTGKKAWADGFEFSGAMTNHGAVTLTPGTSQQSIPQGYHSGSGSVEGDTDLVSANIRADAGVFGVSGNSNVVNTSSGDAMAADIRSGKKAWVDGSAVTGKASIAVYPAPVARTGQTPTVPYNPANIGSDGNLQKGVPWPNPRFTDKGDGTVRDNLTGLIWLKDAGVIGSRAWKDALAICGALQSEECGLSDGSVEGDWRLPNINELQSLIDWRYCNPALPNTAGTGQYTSGDPFIGEGSWSCLTSTTVGDGGSDVIGISLNGGYRGSGASKGYVWPVRDPIGIREIQEPHHGGDYFEDFNDGLAQGWRPRWAADWAVVNGEYRAAAGTNGAIMQATYTNVVWRDLIAEAAIRRTGGTNSSSVLALRASPGFTWLGSTNLGLGSAYLVGINAAGDYYVGYFNNSAPFVFIQGWTRSSYLNTDTTANVVRVTLSGASIQVSFNGQLAFSRTDATIPGEGRFALMGYSGDGGTVETVHFFDNITVTDTSTGTAAAGAQASGTGGILTGDGPTILGQGTAGNPESGTSASVARTGDSR